MRIGGTFLGAFVAVFLAAGWLAAPGSAALGLSSGVHSADQNGNYKIDLTELLRVIQFYNSKSLHCDATTDDGYAPGTGDTTACGVHESDFSTEDWSISLVELLRLIQIYNSGGYNWCGTGVDGYCLGAHTDEAQANVVFLLLDAMRFDRLGATRNSVAISPFLSAFAQTGANFLHTTAPSAWTRPSLVSMFTGQYPNVYQGTDDMTPKERYVIPESATILSEWFANAGYDTWVFQTNGNGDEGFGFDQGYAEGHFNYLGVVQSDVLNDTVIASSAGWSEPFFAYVHFMDVHSPYTPPAEYAEIFGPQPVITASDEYNLSSAGYGAFLEDTYVSWINGTPPTITPLSDNGVEAMRYRYDAEIRRLDDNLAELVAYLQVQFPNTIFVIFADHGESLLDRGMLGHGAGLYEELTHIPFIMQGPGIPPGERTQPVELFGALPALARLLGIAPGSAWQGSDVFRAKGTAPVYSHTQMFSYDTYVRADSVAEGGLKLIEGTRSATSQLFNLATDPGELTDLAATQPDDTARLQALLDAHRAALE